MGEVAKFVRFRPCPCLRGCAEAREAAVPATPPGSSLDLAGRRFNCHARLPRGTGAPRRGGRARALPADRTSRFLPSAGQPGRIEVAYPGNQGVSSPKTSGPFWVAVAHAAPHGIGDALDLQIGAGVGDGQLPPPRLPESGEPVLAVPEEPEGVAIPVLLGDEPAVVEGSSGAVRRGASALPSDAARQGPRKK